MGQWYVVNVELNGDFSTAKQNNDLSGTVDYSTITNLIQKEMAISSQLIEHVAQRIASSLRKSFSLIQSGSVEVVKEYPPVKGVGGVAVVVDI